jgi:hypothetical protein
MVRLILAGILIFLATATTSQILFQNDYPESIYVSFARYVNQGNSGFWVTQGWFTLNRGTYKKAFDAIGPHDSIGYFVVTRISEKPFPGTKRLLVHPTEKFLIKNADLETAAGRNGEYEWRYFRLVRFKPGETSGKIKFSD